MVDVTCETDDYLWMLDKAKEIDALHAEIARKKRNALYKLK